MPRVQYLVEEMTFHAEEGSRRRQVEMLLTQRGEEGWELVSMMTPEAHTEETSEACASFARRTYSWSSNGCNGHWACIRELGRVCHILTDHPNGGGARDCDLVSRQYLPPPSHSPHSGYRGDRGALGGPAVRLRIVRPALATDRSTAVRSP